VARSEDRTTRVLVLTHSEQNRVGEAIIAGAGGYILKSARHPNR
jgi:hypothetical protein